MIHAAKLGILTASLVSAAAGLAVLVVRRGVHALSMS